jgi:hypothetical protein
MAKVKLGSGVRFKRLANTMAREGVEDPDAVAASIGRKKMQGMAAKGKKMQGMAAKGKKRHEERDY